ncbi:MAG: MMPL family transporter [Gammaproteobacteria bacterium]|nr:MMPL family transporter [Gammaproteobacteria bacterium]
MSFTLPDYYDRLILKHPALTLLFVALLLGFFGYHAQFFRLDASADSLILENDQSLRTYRVAREQYGSDDFLVITYSPSGDMFSPAVLTDLRTLRDRLAGLERIESVVSLLDVPLIESPPITLRQLSQYTPTLESPGTDINLARREFAQSPLYRNLLISPDGRTTALQVNFRRDATYFDLLERRELLRDRSRENTLTAAEHSELAQVTSEFKTYNEIYLKQQASDIDSVRTIMDEHRQYARLFLGGVPMIVADSMDYIRHDLASFGIGVLAFMVGILALAFRKLRWILLPIITSLAAGLVMIGFLGLVEWPVTVVSSNFISLMLIISLSINIHLIVRYRELHAASPAADQYTLLRDTLHSKALPCFYTTVTTIVAFGSLLFSDIRPVIDFGWMMAVGTAVSLLLSFTLFPATLMFMRAGEAAAIRDVTARITGFLASLVQHYRILTTVSFVIIVALGIAGINILSVENRFIDYFKTSTEIYRGMELIDRELGGTTPMDVVIDAPREFFETEEPGVDEELFAEDPFFEDMEFDDESAGITGSSYWFNAYRMERVDAIHDYLDGLPETGKVLSITTAMRMLQSLEKGKPIDDFFLAVLYKRLPDSIKQSLFAPYMRDDGNQLRFSIRVFESDPTLRRAELINKVREQLTGEFGLDDEQVEITGMLVLYNNMLQSLFRSQIMTLSVVFLAILLMFVLLFRNLRLATIAVVPNLIAAGTVLGLMGWLNIPLDIMTITIAAIVIGIGVDDAIHYVHRYLIEYQRDGDYWAAVRRSHNSIGRAMYYTTVTVTLGFAILAFSSFIPTIYFGLLTGFAMLMALLANLTLLPLLIAWLKPLGNLPVSALPATD